MTQRYWQNPKNHNYERNMIPTINKRAIQTLPPWYLLKKYVSPSAVITLVTFFKTVTIATLMYVKLKAETGEKIVTTWLEIKSNQIDCKIIKQKVESMIKKNSPEHTCDKHENKYHIYWQPDHNQSPSQWFYCDIIKITRSGNYNNWHKILQNRKDM